MSSALPIALLVIGLMMTMQAKKVEDAGRARQLRNAGPAVMAAALALAVYGAFDLARDHAENDPDTVPVRGVDVS